MQRRELIKYILLTVGASASSSVAQALYAGVSGQSRPTRAIFIGDQRKSVSLLTDMIIPRTDTPGAIDAGVPDFVELMVGDWYTPTEREIFFRGLAGLDAFCKKRAETPFSAAEELVRIAALKACEQEAASYRSPTTGAASLDGKAKADDQHAPFFNKIKELTVLGYYTSEVGATRELAYNPVPGRFDGDYEYAKVGRQWSY